MFRHSHSIRVRYSETDQMGFVYYGVYASYLEVARVEAMRDLGIPYHELEEQGILMPVTSFEIKYLRPAYYDQLLKINTSITQLPATRIRFYYEIFNQENRMINQSSTELAFLRKSDLRPVKVPEKLITSLQPYFMDSV